MIRIIIVYDYTEIRHICELRINSEICDPCSVLIRVYQLSAACCVNHLHLVKSLSASLPSCDSHIVEWSFPYFTLAFYHGPAQKII